MDLNAVVVHLSPTTRTKCSAPGGKLPVVTLQRLVKTFQGLSDKDDTVLVDNVQKGEIYKVLSGLYSTPK